MSEKKIYEIIAFYEFKRHDALEDKKMRLRIALTDNSVCGTIILAEEGYNGSLCGLPSDIARFIETAEEILETTIAYKSSFHNEKPFRKHEVKIKPEIVTLKQPVDISKGAGTHVSPTKWNALISDPETVVLDTRNFYEVKNGTFRGAVDPETEKFSDLPQFVAKKFDPKKHKRIAMFCTGGIRCEKFAPYMIEQGFPEVFQLEGGILKYLEEVPKEEQLWEGECFVFDERRTVDSALQKGSGQDFSQRDRNKKKKGKYGER